MIDDIKMVYGRSLDLNLLRVFAVVAEAGSLTRAASRLYVTQPAISASMRRLTEYVGAELFTRQAHGIVLTTRGLELLEATREHLAPLVTAANKLPAFDANSSEATIRIGLVDCLEPLLLPKLLERLRALAPRMQIVVVTVQFRNVEESLLSNRIDIAVTVADELPRSILREPLGTARSAANAFMCLYDPQFLRVGRRITTNWYFSQEHVVVSYAEDARGIVEDTVSRSRRVRVSVPAFGYLADIVEGSALVATLPRHFARHVKGTRPHLEIAELPFSIQSTRLELLWSRVTDSDAACRFVRQLLPAIVERVESEPTAAAAKRTRRGPRSSG